MKLSPYLLASLALALTGAESQADSQIIQAFEGDGFDNWQTTGTAFGLAPVWGKAEGMKSNFRDYAGNSLACSAHGGDEATGTLTSPELLISHPYLCFLIAGGKYAGKTAVQLLVNGKVVREAVGTNSITLREEVWEVSEFKGQKGTIRILDDATVPWGIIAADHFVFSSDGKPVFPKTVPPKTAPGDSLIRVPGEGTAAAVAGASFKVTGSHEETGIFSPTSITFGNDGSLYVAETHRFRFGVEDDRSNLYWYHDDLASRTTSDRRAMHEKWFSKRSLEWMTAKSEVIRHLSKQDSSGVFTKSEVFADQFNDVLDGTAAGVMAWDDTVYFACIPKLWMLRGQKSGGMSPERKVIEDGFGVKVSLSGHDMNGFVLGYDGRIWGTIGDRGFNLTTKEGRKYDFHNQGAVFRFEPDGSQFEVVHFGLRNPKEIAFDEFGNGISVDNNSDQGDAARVVYIVEGADSGWEMEHQAMHTFHREIGLQKRPPSRWMTERAWELQNPVQPAFIIPPAAYISSGPSGLTYHPGVGFLESEKRHFHICDYKGSAGGSGIWSFKLEPSGAGMKMTESHKLLWGVAATDVEYDWNGNVVVSDFITGWNSHDAGRIVMLSADKTHAAQAASDVSTLIREGFESRNSDELARLLAHGDQRIRLRAQLELTRRPDAVERFERATRSSNPLERVHGIWGLGILARRGPAISPSAAWAKSAASVAPLEKRTDAAKRLLPLLSHSDAEVRAQAIRALSEAPLPGNEIPFAPLLLDPSLRVRSFAAIAAGRMKADHFIPEITAMVKENADREPIIRHAGVFALERTAESQGAFDTLAQDPDASVRMAAVIMLRRRSDSSVSRFLNDPSSAVADEAIRAIHDLNLEAGRPAVASLLDKLETRTWTPFMLRRLIHSAFRLGGEQNATRIVKVATGAAMPAEVRTEALRLLSMWATPFPVDQSTGHWNPIGSRGSADVRVSLNAALPELLKGDSDTLQTTLEMVELHKLDVGVLPDETLSMLVGNHSLGGAARSKALEMLLGRNPTNALEIAERNVTDEKDEVALVALRALILKDKIKAVPELGKAVSGTSTARRQGAWRLLAALDAEGVESLFVSALKELAASKGVSGAAIEILEAAKARREPAVTEALRSVNEVLEKNPDPISRWMPALEGGDPANGFALFQTHPVGQCLRCHQASSAGHAAGGEAGPNLAGVAKRGDRRYLLESIVASSAVVVSGYGSVNIELTNRGTLTGTLLSETASNVDVDVAGKAWRISRKDIKTMSSPVSGMPAMDGLLTQNEVRDLVAWLATLDKGGASKKAVAPEALDISSVPPATEASHIDPAIMAQGRQQYGLCVACHGANGEGSVVAPPLAKSEWVNGPAKNLIRIQLRGLQGPITVSGKTYQLPAPMPAQTFQTDEQIASVLTYIRNAFGNSAPQVTPDQVKALRGESGKSPLTSGDLDAPR